MPLPLSHTAHNEPRTIEVYETTSDRAIESEGLTAALNYAARGWPVVPTWIVTPDGRCECASPDCTHPGKHARTAHAHMDATTDEAQIRSWWTTWPHAGVGIDLNRAGLVDIAPDSEVWLTAFRGPGYGLPRTPSFASGGGAGHEHHLYQRPAACPARRICRAGQYDILADGLAVLPPSPGRHWLVRPDQAELAVVPLWAVERLRAAEQRQEQAKQTARQAIIDAEDEPPVRLSGDWLARWRGELVKMGGNGPGGVNRSDSLFLIALGLARGNASYRTILEAVRERDQALGWGKYGARSDAEERYAEIAAKALGDISPPTPDPGVKFSRLVTAEKCQCDCQPLHEQIGEQGERIRVQDERIRVIEQHTSRVSQLMRKPRVSAAVKLVAIKVLDLQASRESRGERGPIPVAITAEPPPNAFEWIDDSLTAATATDKNTVTRALNWTVQSGLFDKPPATMTTNKRGLSRPRLVLVPQAPIDQQWQAILAAEPPTKVETKATAKPRIRCVHDPLADIARTSTTTWPCTVCNRPAKPPRTTVTILKRIDQVPELPADPLVSGEAVPGVKFDPGVKFSRLVDDSPTVLLGEPQFSRLGDQEIESAHACHSCGAFADASWGTVVEVNVGIWLHAGADAPCRLPMRVAS